MVTANHLRATTSPSLLRLRSPINTLRCCCSDCVRKSCDESHSRTWRDEMLATSESATSVPRSSPSIVIQSSVDPSTVGNAGIGRGPEMARRSRCWGGTARRSWIGECSDRRVPVQERQPACSETISSLRVRSDADGSADRESVEKFEKCEARRKWAGAGRAGGSDPSLSSTEPHVLVASLGRRCWPLVRESRCALRVGRIGV